MSNQRPFFEDDFGGKYLLVDPGTFVMGESLGRGSKSERPAHTVEITEPFFWENAP